MTPATPAVQDVDAPPGERQAERHGGRRPFRPRVDRVEGGADHPFGRAVGVEQAHAAERRTPPEPRRLRGHRLAADHHQAQREPLRIAPLRVPQPLLPIRRRQVDHRQGERADALQEPRRLPQLRPPQDQRRARDQRRQRLLQPDVEARRRELEHAIVAIQLPGRRHRRHVVRRRAVLDRDSLRPAGRARGVDDVGEVLRPGSPGHRATDFVGLVGRLILEKRAARRRRRPARPARGGSAPGGRPNPPA